MSTVQEIKAAIDSLEPADRAELWRILSEQTALPQKLPLPDSAARRRAIFGDRTLPNEILRERYGDDYEEQMLKWQAR